MAHPTKLSAFMSGHFFEEVFDDVVIKYGGEVLGAYRSEMKDFPVHRIIT